MTAYGQPIGSLSSQVASLEYRLAYLDQHKDGEALRKLNAVGALHVMCHGPEDRNWCAECDCQWPCRTRQALEIW